MADRNTNSAKHKRSFTSKECVRTKDTCGGDRILAKGRGIPTSLQPEHIWQKPRIKKALVHATFLGLISAIIINGHTVVDANQTSLLYTLVSGEVLSEGPLDPSAYAQGTADGVGGTRLAAATGLAGVDIITFDDPEVAFAATLGGTSVIAPLSPIAAEPGIEAEDAPGARSNQIRIYTVQEGDTIASIAADADISTNTIIWANGLSERSLLKAGDNLTLLPTTGVLHTVAGGDTLLAIAQRYDVKGEEIRDYNRLTDSHKLSIGQKLIVPDGYIQAPAASATTRLAQEPTGTTVSAESAPAPAAVTGSGFAWPTTSRHISQSFRWGHTGIDIDNRSRPPIYAAASGTVEYAGWLGAYGNLIIINHGNGMQTYYAHNDAHYVAKGATVTKGQAIAKMGSTGRSSGPHVHYEVRRNGRPLNPLGFY